jgi:hypothetical protein
MVRISGGEQVLQTCLQTHHLRHLRIPLIRSSGSSPETIHRPENPYKIHIPP